MDTVDFIQEDWEEGQKIVFEEARNEIEKNQNEIFEEARREIIKSKVLEKIEENMLHTRQPWLSYRF